MNTYLKIFLGILLIIYILSYYNYPKNTKIIQTNMNNFHFDMLNARLPIIIDSGVDLAFIKKNWFNYNYAKEGVLEKSEQWHDNKYKYSILQPQESGEILIYPASKKMIQGIPNPDESLLAIKISKGQLVILPFHWKFMLNVDVVTMGVHDLLTFFLI